MREFEFHSSVKPRPRINQKRLRKEARKNFPPVLKFLVLAHQIDQIIAEGRTATLSDMARQLGISSARLSQIRRFTSLAPAIQEAILRNDDPAIAALSERKLLGVLLTAYQPKQIELFEALITMSRAAR